MERTEAASLLDSVITHWGRLGKTSPAGLRDGFRQRHTIDAGTKH
jgi:hypothetical protein